MPLTLFVLAAFGAALTFSGALADQFGVAACYHNPNHRGLIAAHLALPFGTHVRVYNLDNGRNVVVTIVDRRPYATTGRIIDLSTVAADALGMRQAGVARVRLELVQ
jgi:rare lipoprotein A